MNNKLRLDIYDKNLNPVQINIMKNKLLKKEKEEVLNHKNYNKFNTSELIDKNIFMSNCNNIIAGNNSNKPSERFSLKSSKSIITHNNISNNNSESDYYYKNNFTNIKSNENIGKKMSLNINTKELSRNNTHTGIKNSTLLITSIINMINSSKSLTDKTQSSSNYDKCLICERNFSIINLCCSECNIHFFCRKCLKNYCQELIEEGKKRMKCPITKCNFDIYEEFLKFILSEDYFKLLFRKSLKSEEKTLEEDLSRNKYKIFDKKIKQNSEDKIKNIRLYNNKHVIDVNSNIMLFNVRKYKDEYCPNCHEPSLFCKTSTIFHKCLNCGFKI